MELYFKDLEDDTGGDSVGLLHCGGDDAADGSSDSAEDRAFAELSERVSAARLVY